MSDPILRPEFENAFDGMRRELHTMGENIGGTLAQIQAQLAALLSTHNLESREVGELKVRIDHLKEDVDHLHEANRTSKNQRWMLTVGVVAAIAGQLISWGISLAHAGTH